MEKESNNKWYTYEYRYSFVFDSPVFPNGFGVEITWEMINPATGEPFQMGIHEGEGFAYVAGPLCVPTTLLDHGHARGIIEKLDIANFYNNRDRICSPTNRDDVETLVKQLVKESGIPVDGIRYTDMILSLCTLKNSDFRKIIITGIPGQELSYLMLLNFTAPGLIYIDIMDYEKLFPFVDRMFITFEKYIRNELSEDEIMKFFEEYNILEFY